MFGKDMEPLSLVCSRNINLSWKKPIKEHELNVIDKSMESLRRL